MLSPRAKWVEQKRSAVLGRANVVGCGWGIKRVGGRKTSRQGMVVFVRQKLPRAKLRSKDVVPPSVGEHLTDVVEVGDVKLLALKDVPPGGGNKWVVVDAGEKDVLFDPDPSGPVDRTARWRPAPPGVSIGHINVTAGTFGACVKDKNTSVTYILTNNHVAANATDGQDGKATVGDPILQPGAYDGGAPDDVIGHLTRFVPLQPLFSPPQCRWAQMVQKVLNVPLRLLARNYTLRVERKASRDNVVDCALVKPIKPDVVNGKIVGIGTVRGITEADVGIRVQKSGRTTGVTKGEVIAVGATMEVGLGGTSVARFVDQIVTTPIAQPGDSGSLVLDVRNRVVGLLFAGSDKTTLCNPIAAVCRELNVEF